jgi:hypothetical protein
MKSSDMETLGALVELITNKRYYTNIDPPLSLDNYHPFMTHYYERCFRENPQGEWVDSRYSAGSSFVNWFTGLWNDPEVPRNTISDLKALLAKLYLEGDEDLRVSIITATLEHLFENPQILNFFSDWREQPILRIAYDEATEYAKYFREQKEK